MSKPLSFGLGGAVPDAAPAAWGARWIWPNDQLPNRQSATGDPSAIEKLLDWLNGGANAKARKQAEAFATISKKNPSPWRQRDADQRTLFEDATGIIVGNPNSSYGYLYVAAWLK